MYLKKEIIYYQQVKHPYIMGKWNGRSVAWSYGADKV